MRSDSDIKRDVEDELRWDPDIDPTDVAVAVKNGVVTLTGFVRSYSQKLSAEIDAKRIAGVLGAGERHRGALARHQQEARSRNRA
jgi:osmotically-inducible protein OsmY